MTFNSDPPLSPIYQFRESMTSKLKRAKKAYKDDPFSWSVILIIGAFFAFFLILPLVQILMLTIFVNGKLDFSTLGLIFQNKAFWDPFGTRSYSSIRIIDYPNSNDPVLIIIRGPNLGIFLNTIMIGIFTTIFSLIIGVFVAFLMARVDFPGKVIISGLLLVPLILPPFVSGIGYFAMLGREGLLNDQVLAPLFGIKVVFEGIAAIVFVQTMHYFTLIYLNVYSSFMNNDPSLEEAAENAGASKFTVFRTVTLPLAMPGIASGSILVLILAMEDLGTPVIFAQFGDSGAKATMTYYILNNIYAVANSNELAQESIILSAFLLIYAIIGFTLIRKYVSLKQYSMISKGKAGVFRTLKPKIFGKIIIYLFFVLLFVVATIPHIGIVITSLVKPGKFPLQWTTEYYKLLFDVNQGFGTFVQNTMLYALVATGVIVIFATITSYVISRKEFKGQSIFDMLVTLPIAIPGVVLGIGYIRMFAQPTPNHPFQFFMQNTLVILLFAILVFAIVFIPTLVAIRTREHWYAKWYPQYERIITIVLLILWLILSILLLRSITEPVNGRSIDFMLFGIIPSKLQGYEIANSDFLFTLNPFEFAPIILVTSFTIRKFPFTVRSVYAGLQQTDKVLEEAAENMGATKSRIVLGIVVPIISLNIVAGALIALVYNISEVSTSLVLINSQNEGNITWKMAHLGGKPAEMAAIGVFLMVIQIISLLTTNVLLRNRAEAITGI